MRVVALAVIALPAFAHAGPTQTAVARAVRAAYRADFGRDVFNANTLHAYQLESVQLQGNQQRGRFRSLIISRKANLGAGMPEYTGTYRRVGDRYQIRIDPRSR